MFSWYLIIIYCFVVVRVDDRDVGNETWDPDADSPDSTEKFSHGHVSENSQEACHR